jgi:hypothetical protein
MIKLVIWTILNAQSVCTYQIWISLILWCSTRSEDSKDYKFVIFGLTELKIWINQANRRFDSNLKIVSNWTHKIWIIIALLDSRFPKDSNGISFAIFGSMNRKIWILQDWNGIWFENLFGKSVWTQVGHVAVFRWPVPVQLDPRYGTLDLKRFGCARLTGTLPLKWIYHIHWILFGRPGLKGRELTGPG